MNLLKRIIKEKRRIETKEKADVKSLTLSNKKDTDIMVYFDNNGDVDFLNIYINKWEPYIPSKLVEELLKRYGNLSFYSIGIDDFNISIFNGMLFSQNDYEGTIRNKKIKKFVEYALDELGIKYYENNGKFRVSYFQKKRAIEPHSFSKIYNIGMKENYKMIIITGDIGIFGKTLMIEKIKEPEIDDVSQLLRKYGKDLYDDDRFLLYSYDLRYEKPKTKRFLKF